MTTPPNTKPSVTTRIGAILLVAGYLGVILATALLVPRVDHVWLIAIALVPAVVCCLFGIPKVISCKPRGIMALFHLLVYPLFALIVIGLPGACLTYLIADRFAG
jgi:hypothetical protein